MSTFTSKHYKAIAAIIAAQGNNTTQADMLTSFLYEFSSDNPRFNAGKFRQACLPQEDQKP
jgi:hypothetical protein